MVRSNSEPESSSSPSPRERVLEEAGIDAGRAWAEGYRQGLEQEGRAVEGGWPGTLNEARARSGAQAARTFVKLSMSPPTHDELGRVAKITYAEARRSWRASVGA